MYLNSQYYFLLPIVILLLFLLFRLFLNWKKKVFEQFGNSFRLGEAESRNSLNSSKVSFFLLLLSVIFLSISLSDIDSHTSQNGNSSSSAILVLDVSASMLAKDNGVSRKELANDFAISFINSNSRDVGIIAFAGNAYILSPVTNNSEALREIILGSDPNNFSYQGSDLQKALAMAANYAATSNSKQIIVLTDGELSDGDAFDSSPKALSRKFEDSSIATTFISIGSEKSIRVPKEDYLLYGEDFHTKSEHAKVEQLAKYFGGSYFKISQRNDVKTVISQLNKSPHTNFFLNNFELSSLFLIISSIILMFFWKI